MAFASRTALSRRRSLRKVHFVSSTVSLWWFRQLFGDVSVVVELDWWYRGSRPLVALAERPPRRRIENLLRALALDATPLTEGHAGVARVARTRVLLLEVDLRVADTGIARSHAHVRVALLLVRQTSDRQRRLRPIPLDRQRFRVPGQTGFPSDLLLIIVRVSAPLATARPFPTAILAESHPVVEPSQTLVLRVIEHLAGVVSAALRSSSVLLALCLQLKRSERKKSDMRRTF